MVDYLPYGSVLNKENTGDYENKYLFTGKEQDTESDLQYFEARYYDNQSGRFRSIDRVFWEVGESGRANIGLMSPQRFNSYSYVGNNPLIRTDDSGEWWDVGVDSVVATIGIGVGKVTGDEYLVIGGQNMLKDTLKPQNALNPFKKIKKVEKAFDAGSKITKKTTISIQKQNKHIKGTKEYEQAIGNSNRHKTSTWKDSENANNLTQEAYEKGTPIPNQPNKKIYDTGKIIGENGETKIKVHESKTGIHGHPND